MFYDHFFGLNSFRLACIIACFIILFKNKFYFGYFKKKYEEVSFIWLFFTLILMASFLPFIFSFITMILMLPIFLFLITFNVLHVGFDFRKRKKMSISEFIYFPYIYRVYTLYSYLFMMFSNFILCRINAEIYLFYYEDPTSFVVYALMFFFLIFICLFGFLNAIRIEKLFPNDNFNAM